MGKAWLVALAMLAGLASPAAAQQASDPFGGQFGSMEIALPPREAAHQAELMGNALSGLAPQRPGQLDVYLLVASFWNDPVFESEATKAAEILQNHLGAQGRTIILSAGVGGPNRQYPAATPDNVQAALGRIGSLIDPDEDLVAVFFTSHGAHDGSIAMLERGRMQGALRPANLRDSFMQAGIRNRLVIVSACFSGAFIAPLADEQTIVLTAASPDRTSFGCQPENEWTFFGDAYFNHALRGGAAIIPAFDQAKTLIEQWEREQNLSPPSNPQRFVGPRAAAMLARAERQAAH
ncbi:MAG TPA: C13 family peptidase [Caulobacterales bacterium]|nr:C13 family peptidase [Caulobacterales bacterium]